MAPIVAPILYTCIYARIEIICMGMCDLICAHCWKYHIGKLFELCV
jgi:hypothetical protein